MSRNLALAALSLFVCSGAVWADDVQVGNWKINLSKSHFKTAPAPQSQAVTVVPQGKDGVKLTVNAVNAKGEKSTIEYGGQYDGKENPRTETGASGSRADRVAAEWMDSRSDTATMNTSRPR